MSDPYISIEGVKKVYERPRKAAGLGAALRAFVRPEVERVTALQGVSFTVAEGETLAYIGPNGAGKTTTLKILAGVLHPSEGQVRVLGFVPLRRERAFLRQISFVMSGSGFLSEVAWDLGVGDALRFVGELYGLSQAQYASMLDELVEVLQVRDLLQAPLRQLSHGQRARAELAGALLWQPRVVLLDEPTLGLDLMSQKALRDFLRAYVRRHGACCIITSHYMRDVEELADRLILVDRGQVAAAGSPAEIVQRLSGYKVIQVEFDSMPALDDLAALGRVSGHSDLQATLEVPHAQVTAAAQALLARWPVHDLTIKELSLEEALQRYFAQQVIL
jgi:ABC-2 type transport system ATP-binding protein